MHILSNISFYCFFWHLCNNSFYFFVSSYCLLRGFMNCLLNTTIENTYLCIQKSFMHHQQDFYQSLVIINRYQIIFSLMYVFHVWMVQTDFMNDVQASQYEHFCHEVALCWLSFHFFKNERKYSRNLWKTAFKNLEVVWSVKISFILNSEQ